MPNPLVATMFIPEMVVGQDAYPGEMLVGISGPGEISAFAYIEIVQG